jgi:hypothetical protein
MSTADLKDCTKESNIEIRLRDLNTKAYYLLIALSFLYSYSTRGDQATVSASLKWALVFTLVAAVLPLQDWPYLKSKLECVRWFKVVFLILALILTVCWIGPRLC